MHYPKQVFVHAKQQTNYLKPVLDAKIPRVLSPTAKTYFQTSHLQSEVNES